MLGTLFEAQEDRDQLMLQRTIAHVLNVMHNGYRGAMLTDRQRVLLRLLADRKGIARAIQIGELAERLKTTPREIKATVRDLRLLFRVRVGSSRNGESGGFYLIATKRELFDTVRPFIRQAQSEFEIPKALCEPHELAELEGQLRLDEGAAQ
jgi:hypothetical protein